MLFGENYQFSGESPYKKTEMRMGTLPVTIEDVKLKGDSLYIKGTGFTSKSTVFINGKKYRTVMLSQYSLMAENVKISDGDTVQVGQSSSKRQVLGYSNSVKYDKSKHYMSE